MTQLSLGEYMRRRRRSQKLSLSAVAQRTAISYTHLSRIENDSTIPRAGTVAKIAEAIDGDLGLMLELAGCLPQSILDRLRRDEGTDAISLRRSAFGASDGEEDDEEDHGQALALALAAGLPGADARLAARTIIEFLEFDQARRKVIADLIHSIASEEDGRER